MTRKILAMSLILGSNMGAARVGLPPNWGTLLEKLELPVLVLLSLALQVILALLANQRKLTNNTGIRIIIWSAYMAADSVATFTLGVISTNLRFALEKHGSLDSSIELATFWAPFLLLHLGGPDTITAFALQDNQLWLRHFSYLIVQTGLSLYIFFRVIKRSRLSTLSAMMLVAGVIKYGERTLCLWLASYDWRRSQAVKDYQSRSPVQLVESNGDQSQPVQSDGDQTQPVQSDGELSVQFDGDQTQPAKSNRDQAPLVQSDEENVENEHGEELLATKILQKTEHMFADVLLQGDPQSFSKIIMKRKSSSVVSKLITMMYENLYTKAKVTHSWWGLALHLISFHLTLITLILFSFFHHRHDYSTLQLSVTYLLLVVAILLEGYAAFLFLTSCRTISWLREHGINMKCVSSLRTRDWSNSMGQFSMVNSSLTPKPMSPFSKVKSTFHRIVVVCIMRKPELLCHVYERPVKYYVKERIHQYLLNQAQAKHNGGLFPMKTCEEEYGEDHYGGAEDDPTTWLNFRMEFGEMVIFWHFVTEVCYYVDYPSLFGEKFKTNLSTVYLDWKISKFLSRYLMQLYVISSDLLPPRGPLSEQRFFNDYNDCSNSWRIRFDADGGFNIDEMCYPEEERNEKAADKKQRRKRHKVQMLRTHCVQILGDPKRSGNPIFDAAVELMKDLLAVDEPGEKLNRKWQLLSKRWIELLIKAANQCKGNQHAQHLSQGGEFLTYVWVHLGHLELIKRR